MLDLVCQRYPGKRPSDYLEIEDPYTALQLDYAVAIKHQQEDFEYDGSKIDVILNALKPIGTALGVKYTEVKPDAKNTIMPQDLPVDTVLAMLGGKGTKVIRNE